MKLTTSFTAISLGILTLSIQIILLREVLQVFLGNELTIGLSLAIWLLGTTVGSLYIPVTLNSATARHFFALLIFPITLLSYLFIQLSPKIFHFLPGVPHDLGSILIVLLTGIFPAASICGFLFPYIVENILCERNVSVAKRIRAVYILESLGAMLAALMLHLILFTRMNHFQILLICLLLFSVILVRLRKHLFTGTGFKSVLYSYLATGIVLLIFQQPLIEFLNNVVLQPYQLVRDEDTPYGNHKLMRLEDQTIVLTQGVIEYTQPDIYSAEMRMLLPIILYPQAEKILIVGGNLHGFIQTVEQLFDDKKITYLEKDPFLLNHQKELVQKQMPASALSIGFVQSDVRSFLNKVDDVYDIICLNKPEPVTLADNRFYTREFFQLLGQRLQPEGIFIYSLRSSENFINPSLAKYLNLHRNTLLAEFQKLFIIPGDDAVFLASQQKEFDSLLAKWSATISDYQISPRYLTAPYMSYRLSAERLTAFKQRLDQFDSPQVNSDFNLKGYIYHYQLWGWISDPVLNRIFLFLSTWSAFIIPIILVLFLTGMLITRNKTKGIFLLNLFMVGGYAVSLEIIFILQYQILYGSIYTSLAIIFGLFMLGLAAGAEAIDKKERIVRYKGFNRWTLMSFVLLTAALFIPIYTSQAIGASDLFQWIFGPLFVLLLGLMTGVYFAFITGIYYQVSKNRKSGVTYGMDLLGGMVFSFLVSVFLIPLLEISGMLILLAGMMVVQVVLQKE